MLLRRDWGVYGFDRIGHVKCTPSVLEEAVIQIHLYGRPPIFLPATEVAILLDRLHWEIESGSFAGKAIARKSLTAQKVGGGDAA